MIPGTQAKFLLLRFTTRLAESVNKHRGAASAIAKEAGLSPSVIHKIAFGIVKNPSYVTVERISAALDRLESAPSGVSPEDQAGSVAKIDTPAVAVDPGEDLAQFANEAAQLGQPAAVGG